MKKQWVSWEQVESYSHEIVRQISCSRWQPDYVVGITRGGLVPATLISHWLGCPMETLSVKLRDHAGECESNLWMSEDAFGYNMAEPKNILIVDDLNDSGSTLEWIVNDWQRSCLPSDPRWESVWNQNVRFATLFDKLTSDFSYKVDYFAEEISPDNDAWFVFPWENWWRR